MVGSAPSPGQAFTTLYRSDINPTTYNLALTLQNFIEYDSNKCTFKDDVLTCPNHSIVTVASNDNRRGDSKYVQSVEVGDFATLAIHCGVRKTDTAMHLSKGATGDGLTQRRCTTHSDTTPEFKKMTDAGPIFTLTDDRINARVGHKHALIFDDRADCSRSDIDSLAPARTRMSCNHLDGINMMLCAQADGRGGMCTRFGNTRKALPWDTPLQGTFDCYKGNPREKLGAQQVWNLDNVWGTRTCEASTGPGT